jgi:hypothetical protein
MNADLFRRLTSRVTAAVSEMNYAQRRMVELRLALDNYLLEPDESPATYQEFLARTSGLLLHEPTARQRDGHQRGCPRQLSLRLSAWGVPGATSTPVRAGQAP